MNPIFLRRDDAIVTIAINNPARLNCLGSAQIAALLNVVSGLVDDPDLRVLVVTGVGERAFIGGAI